MIDMAYRETAEVAVNQHKTKTVRKDKPIKMMLLDAAIVGGIAFIASFGDMDTLLYAGKAFLGAFVFQLAIDRGIKKK